MARSEALAIHGGAKVRTEPMNTRLERRFDEQELAELKEALDQQTLFYWFGEKVKTFCRQFAAMYGMKHCHMVTSGTAALHVANAAAGVGPGDEVIASPMTDQGTVISILAQGAVPIFADLDPHTYNMTAKNIEKCITKRTKAINVVHLAGNAADMDPIFRLAKKRGLRVIEDCAQSYLCWYKGRLVGTMGDLGCFSLNDFKHISAGDAGMVVTNDDALSARVQLYLDKGYARDGSGRQPPFLGFNYRPSELHGAVAMAQLRKLPGIVAQRTLLGERLTQQLKGVPGILPAKVQRGCKSSYWFYMGRMAPERLGVSREDFVSAVAAEGVPVSAGYIGRMVYEYPLLVNHNAYENSMYPWDGKYGRKVKYGPGMCPMAEAIEATSWRCPLNEAMSEQDVDDIASAVRKVARYFARRQA